MKTEEIDKELKERIKELNCLYEISQTISASVFFEEKALRKMIHSIKNAWEFSDDVIVELHAGNYYLTTLPIPEESIFQMSQIKLSNTQDGFIKVHYPADKFSQNQFLQ